MLQPPTYRFEWNIVKWQDVVEGHGVNDALKSVALPILQSDWFDVAVFSVAWVEGKAAEGSPLPDVLVDHERPGLFRGTEAVKTIFVNLKCLEFKLEFSG